jgi:hypothetical protein
MPVSLGQDWCFSSYIKWLGFSNLVGVGVVFHKYEVSIRQSQPGRMNSNDKYLDAFYRSLFSFSLLMEQCSVYVLDFTLPVFVMEIVCTNSKDNEDGF